VRLYVIHGPLERHFTVYDSIEVHVHPIRVHLTYQLAQVCAVCRALAGGPL